MRAVVYLRQSQDRDGSGLAIDRQRQDCLKLCEAREWDVTEVLVDNDVSASTKRRRPGFERLRALIEQRATDVVVAWHVDRLVRRLVDLEDLIELCERANVRMATVSGDIDLSTDAGRLVGRILASVARGEVERKAARQRRSQQQAAQDGRRVGGRRPFGYERDGMTIRPVEAKAIKDGFEKLLAGASIASIAADWNARGLTSQFKRTKPGEPRVPSPWRADSVRYVLMNARYAGLRSYRGEVVASAKWPAIVSEETWRASVDIMTDPARLKPPRSGTSLLTGVALCGVCEAAVHQGRNKFGARNYRCRQSYGHVGRAADPVDEYIERLVVARMSRADAVDLLVDDDRPDVVELRTEAMALRKRLDVLATEFADGTLTKSQLRVATERVRSNLRAVENAMSDAGRLDVLGPLIRSGDVQAYWDGMSTDRRRIVIDKVMRIWIMSPGRGTRTFRPETVRTEWRGKSAESA